MKTIVDKFIQAASQYPDNVAVCDCEGSLTYRELDKRSNVMAHQIGSPYVLVLLPRRSSFLVAAYGAMKAGSCYVVASPDYPSDRIAILLPTAMRRRLSPPKPSGRNVRQNWNPSSLHTRRSSSLTSSAGMTRTAVLSTTARRRKRLSCFIRRVQQADPRA